MKRIQTLVPKLSKNNMQYSIESSDLDTSNNYKFFTILQIYSYLNDSHNTNIHINIYHLIFIYIRYPKTRPYLRE